MCKVHPLERMFQYRKVQESNSAILDGCIVGSDSVVEGCMIGKNTEIGSNVEIIDVVVDFDAKIPSGYMQKGGCFPNN